MSDKGSERVINVLRSSAKLSSADFTTSITVMLVDIP